MKIKLQFKKNAMPLLFYFSKVMESLNTRLSGVESSEEHQRQIKSNVLCQMTSKQPLEIPRIKQQGKDSNERKLFFETLAICS